MAKFIMANRRAGKYHDAEKRQSRASLDLTFSTKISPSSVVTSDNEPEGDGERRIIKFEADPAEIAEKIKHLPEDVLIEPEILHYPVTSQLFHAASWLPFAHNSLPVGNTAGTNLTIRIKGAGADLPGAEVTLFLRSSTPGTPARKVGLISDASGHAGFSFDPFWIPAALVIVPPGGFWSYIVRGPQDNMTIDLPRLPRTGPLGWWHHMVNINDYDENRGRGIRIGVVDTGCGPHPSLSHVSNIGSLIDSNYNPTDGHDVDSHGSHVCGTIGARPAIGTGDYAGIAPGADIYSSRVFPGGDVGADQGDVAAAIDRLSRSHEVDLINLSIGAKTSSQIEQDAVRDALERGTLCICAAGNSSGPLEYPGAFPEVVGVSCLGLEGWAPHGSISSNRYPEQADKYGDLGLFVSDFSCFGDGTDCTAPGVGIISTVPDRGGQTNLYSAMDGTSMSSPVVCGVLAVILSNDADYSLKPRDFSRAAHARNLLMNNCRNLNLHISYQGRGLPRV